MDGGILQVIVPAIIISSGSVHKPRSTLHYRLLEYEKTVYYQSIQFFYNISNSTLKRWRDASRTNHSFVAQAHGFSDLDGTRSNHEYSKADRIVVLSFIADISSRT